MDSIHKYNTKGELVKPWEDGYYSVTTILDVRHKKKLWDWKMRVGWEEANNKMLDAQGKGKAIHQEIEGILGMDPFNHVGVEWPEVKGFLNWWNKVDPTCWLSEEFLVSHRHKYAGRADLLCLIDGQDWVIDFKTGSKSIDHGLQLAAYRQAWQEQTGNKKARTACLYLTDKTKKGWQFVEYKEPVNVFLAHKKIFDWQLKHEPHKEPKVVEPYIGGTIHVEDAD